MNKTPKLRFKEFSGDWNKKRLSEIASIKGGYAFKSKEFSNYKDKYQVIKMGNLYQNQLLLDRSPSYKKEITEKEEQYLLKSGDIIITLTGTVGKKDFGYSYRISDEKNLLLNQRLGLIRNKENISDDRFLKYTVLDKFFLDQFFESSVGGTGNQANVSTKNMEEFYVYSPKLEEQEKIASFFSLIDDKISLQGEKVEALKDYKTGMMQKIFSRVLRFKDDDGRDYPEWEEKKLGDLLKYISSGKTKSKNEEGRYKVYGSMGVIGYTENKEYEGEHILIARVGANAGTVNIINEPCGISDNTLAVKCNEVIDCRFLYYKLNQYNLSRLVFGSGQPLITGGQVKDIKVYVPTLNEQIKISKYLYVLENKLKKEQEKLDYLNEYKKGLLQQMFV
ncbi:restriction endonuclease subunit S [Romboutsia maritimum]|uniref:Restriction endonuclease subunit S n=1 Tax=Romboutsia maritimum TaxID=2020948 RepID=A0A371IR17_9FIRM|nr:restriction endonuclease subunit S [Romboutsia maritimum]RDY22925.1 restriction endonuclease subunit S [Romboutsia maritimum]